jgi:hypothetical protein
MVTLTNYYTSSVVPNGSTFNLYAYEYFRFDLSAGTYSFTGTSVELIAFCSGIYFQSTTGFNSSSATTLVFKATESGGDSVTIYFKINPGRFLLGGVNPFIYYKSEAIPDLTLTAMSSHALSAQPISTRSLPPGLAISTVSTNSYKLSGTPTVTVANADYLIYGSSGSKVFTTTLSIQVLSERLKVSPTTASSSMTVGSAITPLVITATMPTAGPFTGFSFTLSRSLPDGLSMSTSTSNPTVTATISGTPTITAAKNGTVTMTLVASQSRGAGNTLTASVPLYFSFGETVIFDDIASMDVYANVPIFPRTFRAATYFVNTGAAINYMNNTEVLPLGLTFDSNTYVLSGTPTEIVSDNYDITASNVNGKSCVLAYPITIRENVIDVLPSFLNLVNCIVSKQIEAVQFVATSGSGIGVTFSYAPEGILANYGLNLSSSGLLTGIPNAVLSNQSVTIYASATDGSATTEVPLTLTISPDTFTFETRTLTFIQNIAITPFTFIATAASGHPVQTYSASGLPSGLRMSTTGYVSGTPTDSTSGALLLTVSTGYTSGSQYYSYTLIEDVLFLIGGKGDTAITTTVDNVTTTTYPYSLTPGSNIPSITVDALSFSGTDASNFQFFNFTPTYGLSITTDGVFSGTLTDSIPPSAVLPSSKTGYVEATAGSLNSTIRFLLDTQNALYNRALVSIGTGLYTLDKEVDTWNLTEVYRVGNNITNINAFYINENSFTYMFDDKSPGLTHQSYNGEYIRYSNPDQAPVLLYQTIMPTIDIWYSIGEKTPNLHILKSIDAGITWSNTADVNLTVPSMWEKYGGGFEGGTIAKSGSNIFVGGSGLGGHAIAYTSDEGSNWNYGSGDPGSHGSGEIRCFCFDGPSLLLAGGSSETTAIQPTPITTGNNTIFYSSDSGSTWTGIQPTAMNFTCTNIMYAGGQWVASGKNYDGAVITNSIIYSTDGSNWNVSKSLSSMNLSMPWNDGSNWYCIQDTMAATTIFSNTFPLGSSNWQNIYSLSNCPGTIEITKGAYWMRPYSTSFSTTLTFDGFVDNPVFVFLGPTQTTLNYFKYVPITPLSISVGYTNSGVQLFPPYIFVFVDSSTIPTGLIFDRLTCILSGTPVETGDFSIRFYATDASQTYRIKLDLTLIISIPLVVKKLDGAGAVTSLIRQQALANGVERSRDSNVFPDRAYILGAFSAPLGVDVTTTVIPESCR